MSSLARLTSDKLCMAQAFMIVSYLAIVVKHFDCPQSNSLHWPSRLTDITLRPFSTGQPSVTPRVCPVRVTGDDPSSADQILSRRSAPPDKTTKPEGKNLQKCTSPTCPSRTLFYLIKKIVTLFSKKQIHVPDNKSYAIKLTLRTKIFSLTINCILSL